MSAPDPIAAPTWQPISELTDRYEVNIDSGLSDSQATERRRQYGSNELRAAAVIPGWKRLLSQFHNPVVYLLLAAVGIALLTWAYDDHAALPVDVIVILAVLLLNATLGYLQEARADRAVAALREATQASSSVVRNGGQIRVAASELVVGDILIVNEGDSIGADARLIEANNLRVSEAALTGESHSVLKDASARMATAPLAEQANMLFKGTGVNEGNGVALVTAVGMQTQIGMTSELLEQTDAELTPLQREISRISRTLAIVVVLIAALVIVTLLVLHRANSAEHLFDSLLLGVSLAVAAVPEGLPAILSIVLALGVQRMAGRHAVIKHLASVETLGSASVICTDKTGTLTRAEMTVQRVVTASGETLFSGVGYDPVGQVQPAAGESESPEVAAARSTELSMLLQSGALANNARLIVDDQQQAAIQGDPTEAALLVAERKLGSGDERKQRFTRTGEIPFTSARKRMSVMVSDQHHDGRGVLVTKGAPDELLGRCDRLQQGGEAVPLTDERREQLLADVTRLAGDALRTLAFAYRELEPTSQRERAERPESLETGMIYLGVAGLIDPPRLEVAPAIDAARSAGITVMMMTGDHPDTAARIAADLQMSGAAEPVITGAQIDAMDEAALQRAIESTRVFARVEPVHKMRIVDTLQAAGHIVAMTGDGVNDAPALKSADIGIAMGITGTEVTKEAADMILADDRFATIVDAVREGRGIFSNLRHALRYLLSSNMGEVLTIFLGVLLAGWLGLSGQDNTVLLPLLATQILWINLITDSGPALVIGLEPVDDSVMQRPPRRAEQRMIDKSVWSSVIQIGLVMAVASLLTLDLYLPGGMIEGSGDLTEARTAAFTVLVFAQLFNCLNARSESHSVLHHLTTNKWLLVTLAVAIVLQVAVVHLPVVNTAFTTTPMNAGQWGVCVLMASTVLWFEEARKWLRRQYDRPANETKLTFINHRQ